MKNLQIWEKGDEVTVKPTAHHVASISAGPATIDWVSQHADRYQVRYDDGTTAYVYANEVAAR